MIEDPFISKKLKSMKKKMIKKHNHSFFIILLSPICFYGIT